MNTFQKLLLLFVLILLFACQPVVKNELQRNLLLHNYPSTVVDFPIDNPIILHLKEGVPKKIRGNFNFDIIFKDYKKKKDFEITGTIFVENKIVRVAEAINYQIIFKLKNLYIVSDREEVAITKNNIEEITKKGNFKRIFNEYNIGFTLNKQTKEFSFRFMDKINTEKIVTSTIWDNFEENYIKSVPLKTGDKLYPLAESAIINSSIKNESYIIEKIFYEDEVKGIKIKSNKNYLVSKLTSRIALKYYDKRRNQYKIYNIKGGGYKLYKIPNLFASKYFLSFYIDTNDSNISIGISFDGLLSE